MRPSILFYLEFLQNPLKMHAKSVIEAATLSDGKLPFSKQY